MSTTSKIARWWVMGRKGMSDPLITVVKMNGVLQASTGRGPQSRRSLNLERVEKWLQRAFFKELRPAAVAIAVNSPGGSPVQSELIYDMICRLKGQTGIPVYTFAEDVAASGGYWLLCAGDHVHACATSLVGSIGVVSSTFGAMELAKTWGIERRVYTAGKAKVPLDPFLPVSEEQRARLQDIMEDIHGSFQDCVKQARGERLKGSDEEIFSGRAWTGRQAEALGLVDGVGSLRGVMRREFGDRARFLLCSEAPTPGLRDVLGLGAASEALWTWRRAGTSLGLSEALGGEDAANGAARAAVALGGEEAAYEAARAVVAAALDEAQERAVYDRWRVC